MAIAFALELPLTHRWKILILEVQFMVHMAMGMQQMKRMMVSNILKMEAQKDQVLKANNNQKKLMNPLNIQLN